MRCGSVALIGPSNAGKSTLLNAILGEKVAIVCHKSQTTRTCLSGIHTQGETQIIFVDTPGIFDPKKNLERRMVGAAWSSLEGVDRIMMMVDATRRVEEPVVQRIFERLKQMDRKVDLILNKIDLLRRQELLPKIQAFVDTGLVEDVFMISAQKQDGIEAILTHLEGKMPEAPWRYPEDQLADIPQKLMATEVTREKFMHHLHEEIPYEAMVLCDTWEEHRDGSVRIVQSIVVANNSQRLIVLGKGGQKIRAIGMESRMDLQVMLGRKVHLILHVRVDKKWQEKDHYYSEIGFDSGHD